MAVSMFFSIVITIVITTIMTCSWERGVPGARSACVNVVAEGMLAAPRMSRKSRKSCNSRYLGFRV